LKKIEEYKKQDLKTEREINDDEYINIEWFKNQMKTQKMKCYICNNVMSLISKYNSMITVDRINSNIFHSKENSKLACKLCNSSKLNK
jgi:hypothetical protein